MFYETLKLALQSIARNATRSFLTVLGIIIGVGAVIAMVTIGNGTTAKVNADLAKLGSNILFVRPGQFGPGRASTSAPSFNERDIAAIRDQVNGLRAVPGLVQAEAIVLHSTSGGPLRYGCCNGGHGLVAPGPAHLQVSPGQPLCVPSPGHDEEFQHLQPEVSPYHTPGVEQASPGRHC